MRVVKCVEQSNQRTNERCVEATDFIVGLDTLTRGAGAYRVTEQHAPQAETPAVLFQLFWQA